MLKPNNIDEYIIWATSAINTVYDEKMRTWYEANARAVINTAAAHPFFANLATAIQNASKDYVAKTGVELLMNDGEVNLRSKPYASIVDKSFRRNVLENKKFPGPPDNGWLLPTTWFKHNNDNVRETLVCKYIDGPRFLAEALKSHAASLGLEHRSKSQQNDDGYYAYHFYVRIPVEITSFEWTPTKENVEVELQITTQLQEILRALTHRFYEHRRIHMSPDPDSWKWDTDSGRFRAGYLGHTLHMLEALIIELRDKKT